MKRGYGDGVVRSNAGRRPGYPNIPLQNFHDWRDYSINTEFLRRAVLSDSLPKGTLEV